MILNKTWIYLWVYEIVKYNAFTMFAWNNTYFRIESCLYILEKTLGYLLHVYLFTLLRLNVEFAAEWSNMLHQQTQTTRAEFQSAGNSAMHTLISHELQRYSLLNMITKTNKRGRETKKSTLRSLILIVFRCSVCGTCTKQNSAKDDCINLFWESCLCVDSGFVFTEEEVHLIYALIILRWNVPVWRCVNFQFVCYSFCYSFKLFALIFNSATRRICLSLWEWIC